MCAIAGVDGDEVVPTETTPLGDMDVAAWLAETCLTRELAGPLEDLGVSHMRDLLLVHQHAPSAITELQKAVPKVVHAQKLAAALKALGIGVAHDGA
jgi:hypothetical protein